MMRNQEMMIPLAFIIGGTVVFLTKIVASNITQMVCHWRDTALKERMISAGMSSREIAEVVSAGRPDQSRLPSRESAEYGKPPVMKAAR